MLHNCHSISPQTRRNPFCRCLSISYASDRARQTPGRGVLRWGRGPMPPDSGRRAAGFNKWQRFNRSPACSRSMNGSGRRPRAVGARRQTGLAGSDPAQGGLRGGRPSMIGRPAYECNAVGDRPSSSARFLIVSSNLLLRTQRTSSGAALSQRRVPGLEGPSRSRSPPSFRSLLGIPALVESADYGERDWSSPGSRSASRASSFISLNLRLLPPERRTGFRARSAPARRKTPATQTYREDAPMATLSVGMALLFDAQGMGLERVSTSQWAERQRIVITNSI